MSTADCYDETVRRNYHYLIVEVNETTAGINRDDLVRVLRTEYVLARRYFYPGCHMIEPYRSHFPHAGLLLPSTQQLAQQVVSLPTGTAVGAEEVEAICAVIRPAASKNQEPWSELASMREWKSL
ncbi:DegT/DnrJ/EryC1/StrS family aminotransferase [Chloroflexota bacterium]